MTAVEDDFLRRLDRAPLDANRLADRYASFRERDALMATFHERLRAGVDSGLTGSRLGDLVAEMSQGEFTRFLNRFDWEQRRDLSRFPDGYPTPWRLGQVHQDLQAIAAAVYRDAPESAVAGLSESSREVVRAIADSDMSVQPLKILDDPRGYGPFGSRSIEPVPPSMAEVDERDGRPADRHAAHQYRREGREVIRAVALAAHYSGARVLAVPAHAAALNEARTNKYAHHIAEHPDAAIEKLVGGEWKRPPPGALIVVDDADELDTDQVHQLSRFAGETNTKLLLVTADHNDRSQHWSRQTTDALVHQLPWGQHVGNLADYRLCARAADTPGELRSYLDSLSETPTDIAHQEAVTLLQGHQQIIAAYTALAAPLKAVEASLELEDNRQHGLCI